MELLKAWAEVRNLRAFCRRHGVSHATIRSWMYGAKPYERTLDLFAKAIEDDQVLENSLLAHMYSELYNIGGAE